MIRVKCSAPKYAKGQHEFRGLEELYNWLIKVKCLPRGNIGSYLYKLSKDGHVDRTVTARYDIEIESDFHDCLLAQEIAQKVGLLRHKRGALEEVVSPNLPPALKFAKAFDEEVKSSTQMKTAK